MCRPRSTRRASATTPVSAWRSSRRSAMECARHSARWDTFSSSSPRSRSAARRRSCDCRGVSQLGVTRERMGWRWATDSVVLMTKRRKVIVHIAASADGYIARPDGDIDWLTSRPAPKGFYGMDAFIKSIDTTVLGRKTYEESLRLGATFDAKKGRTVVFSRSAAPADAPEGVRSEERRVRKECRSRWSPYH